MNLQEFEPLIASVIAKSPLSKDYNLLDDLKQDLRVRLCEILNSHKWEFENLTRPEIFGIIKTAFKNHLHDKMRYKIRRPDTSMYTDSETDKYSESDLSGKVGNQHQIAAGNNICEKIVEWAAFKSDPDYLKYVRECVEPSTATEEAWELLQEASKNYRRMRSIPPLTLIRIIDLKQGKMYRIRKDLEKFLKSNGLIDEEN